MFQVAILNRMTKSPVSGNAPQSQMAANSRSRPCKGTPDHGELREALANTARREGFRAFGVCAPDVTHKSAARLDRWIADGAHGEMSWMADRIAWRTNPARLLPGVQSILLFADSCAPTSNPLSPPPPRNSGAVAVYAQGRDYHIVMKQRLKRIARWLQGVAGGEVRVFVDTAPVLEKPLAEAAGIGWQGKHTNLVSTEFGSWLLLGSIFTTLPLPRDTPHRDRCGSCRRCLDICPTAAFPAPYRLDARRCISYLTIEHKSAIPRALRPLIGNRVFGCDDCLAVCPWNRFAAAAQSHSAFRPAASSEGTELRRFARMDDAQFRQEFRGTPVRRTGRDRFLRNVLIAIGNSGDRQALREVDALLSDPTPLVRGAAIWALSRLASGDEFRIRMDQYLPGESDSGVRAEWRDGDAERQRAKAEESEGSKV